MDKNYLNILVNTTSVPTLRPREVSLGLEWSTLRVYSRPLLWCEVFEWSLTGLDGPARVRGLTL